jgi:ubiquinone/menaquinone biosynthesis C-methylase UbiE
VSFKKGDATKLPFPNEYFDAAMTIHVVMNIAAKDNMYAEAARSQPSASKATRATSRPG